ncbi:MAG: KpsF/GutQ family sugar-phosphate isomerase [Bacteroidota bacterium]|nr:KpsF/GutQ family sugar-phosphate isomerase [Bacteroidota bacterium]
MDKKIDILNTAKDCFTNQSNAIAALQDQLNEDFVKVIDLIFKSNSRLVITGIGKSALIGMKITATLNSTGTRSIFMHAADAIHGDLGMVAKEDIVVFISKSGNTPEIKALVPLIKVMGNNIIGMTGNPSSFLAQESNYVLSVAIQKEACPNNLAPTTSTTAQLVMGDAIAICLLEMHGFDKNNFAQFHPGGSLGKTLYLKVNALVDRKNIPAVQPNSSISDVIIEIGEKLVGATAVMENEKVCGIITDGDIRRVLEKTSDLSSIRAKDIMNPTPKMIKADILASEALNIMQKNNISQLLVINKNDEFIGIVHLHNILNEGIG